MINHINRLYFDSKMILMGLISFEGFIDEKNHSTVNAISNEGRDTYRHVGNYAIECRCS